MARRWTYYVALSFLALLAAAACQPRPWLAAGAALAPLEQKGGALLAAWVQHGADGAVLARALTRAPSCPPLQLEGRQQPMVERAAPAPPAFPERVCEAVLPPGASAAAIEGQALVLPRPSPQRIVVFGDAGCRLEDGRTQACNDPRQWPFAAVAQRAATWQPDLVIHVGDYLYREDPCPAGNQGCAGSPTGDTLASWQADLFAPAAPLLRASPWVFVRGNHELCSRGGDGWFRWLEPRAPAAPCSDYTEPYAVALADLQLLVLDSANADDFEARPELVARYAAQFETLRALAGPKAWLLTHRPLWAVGVESEDGGTQQLFRTNPTLQAASENRLPAGVRLVVSGHLHQFELLTFEAARPPQLVAGTGGTYLDRAITVPLAGVTLADTAIAAGTSVDRWGYFALERDGAGWRGALRGPDDAVLATCQITAARTGCER